MKRYIRRLIILLPVFFLAVSCMKESEKDSLYYFSLGEIESVGNEWDDYLFKIVLDNETMLIVVDYATEIIELVKEDRVFFTYTNLGPAGTEGGKRAYYAKIIGFDHIISKPVIKESFIRENQEHRQDSIGDDLIMVKKMWFGGRFLNIEFEYLRKNMSEEPHMINLVWDDLSEDDETINLTLRHNAYGELSDLVTNYGFCSFPLSMLVPEGENEVNIRLKYNWNGGSNNEKGEYELTGIFNAPFHSNGTPEITNTGVNILTIPENKTTFVK